MKLPGFLQRLFGRHDFKKSPPPHGDAPKAARVVERPTSAWVPLDDLARMTPILDRLAEMGILRATLILDDAPDRRALLGAVEHARRLGIAVGVWGRGSDLAAALVTDLASAGCDRLKILLLSSIAEVHDALAGVGDCRGMQRALDLAQHGKMPVVAQIALVPSTRPTIERTLEFLADRGVAEAEVFVIASPDDEPSSWAIAAKDVPQAIEAVNRAAALGRMRLSWYPTIRFDPSRTLAGQVQQGPRCGGDTSMRVEPDGRVFPARGLFQAAGNLLTDSWETIAGSEAFQEFCRHVGAAPDDPSGFQA
jgi:MoaA/NifB/PqqE/SkfB family radical SAM enzyme